MGGAHAGPVPEDMGDWMRRQEKRVLHEERRPLVRKASDIMGPGLAPEAVEIPDWSGPETEFNGFYFSRPGALHSPDSDLWWIGTSISHDGSYGVQHVWDYRSDLEPPAQMTRTFRLVGDIRLFSPWSPPDGGLVGEMKMWVGAQTPAGYLTCDGRQLSRDDYPILFGIIGTSWGAGNGTTTFNLPDMRDRVPMGHSTARPFGTGGGKDSITLSAAQMPAHDHSMTHNHDITHSHVGTLSAAAGSHQNRAAAGAAGTFWMSGASFISEGGGNSGGSSASTTGTRGSGSPVDITPPYRAVTYIIRAA